MKKFLLLSMLIILPFGMTGCFKKEVKEEVAQQNQESAQVEGGIKVNEPNTIMGWLKSGKGMECELMTPEGDGIIVRSMGDSMPLGDKVEISGFPYMDMANPNSEEIIAGHSLTVGDMMYMWGGKSGIKMDMKKMEEISAELGEAVEEEPDTWEDMIQDWDETNVDYKCTEKRFSANDFIVPSDVEFQDFTTLLEGMADMGTQMQDSLDGDGEVDLKALQEQAEALKAQYEIK